MRRNGRVTSLVGAFVIAVLVAAFVEYDFPVPHLITIASSCAWVLVITCMTKQRWLRWLRDEFAGEVSAKLDGIRRAAPFN